MAAHLADIRGAFIMSINDTPKIREVFDQFHLDDVRLSYTVSGTSAEAKARELIVSNWEVRAGLL